MALLDRPRGRSAGERLRDEAELALWEVRHGRFQRSMALTAAFSAIVSGWEAYSQHQRGAFADWLMWTPVALTPAMVGAAGAAVVSGRAARRLLPVVSLVSLVDGVVGFVFHLRGIHRLPGGFRLGQYNIVMGPPIFAPLLTCTIGVLGIVSALSRREEPEPPLTSRALARVRSVLPSPNRPRPEHLPRRLANDIASGRFQQGMALTSAFFAVLSGGEAYFEHLRGSFNQRWMWTPVWVTPPMVAAGVAAARSERAARTVLPFMSSVTFLDGLLGFLLHVRGIRRMAGSYTNLRFNLTMGPPLFAPLLFCSVGLLGLIAALLRRQEGSS